MSDQQPSKTPRTDATGLQCPDCFEFILVPSIGDYYRCPKCNIGDWSEKALCLFKKGVTAGHKQLETELATANAEVENWKRLMMYLVKKIPHTGLEIGDEVDKLVTQRDALLANSKALASELKDKCLGEYGFFDKSEALAVHNKLMEQFK